jgi:D-hydroxyproline dehydrogenase subunit alpha
VTVDEWQRTTQPGILAAGDGTGVAGSYVAIDQGRLAALGAALDLGALAAADASERAAPLRRRLRQKQRFAAALRRLHRVGEGIYELSTPETIVCRCEEVTAAQLDEAIGATDDLNVVKTLTRTAMGLCQGRNCQRHVAATIARHHGRLLAELPVATPRPPVRPVPIGAIADASLEDKGFFFE